MPELLDDHDPAGVASALVMVSFPPDLRAGDVVRVIAPSSSFDQERFRRGVDWLARHYTVRYRPDVGTRSHYLAGSDQRRMDELREALGDREARAIVAARGGYGALRIVSDALLAPLAERPVWLVGFSDVTVLHVEAARLGVASMHASMAAALGEQSMETRAEWVSALRADYAMDWPVTSMVTGRASGPLFGGNLTLLAMCACAGRLKVPPGAILMLEDCNERPYRLDRMLTALQLGGYFDALSAIVCGEFTGGPWPEDAPIADVLFERLGKLGIPVAFGAPFGHGEINRPWIQGQRAELVEGRLRAHRSL